MYTSVQIVNMGLARLGSSPITRLDPPRSSLERHIATNYEQWKREEMTKRRWVFALEDDYPLAKVQDASSGPPLQRSDARNHKYLLPTECLRPVRTSGSEWVQRGRYIYSAYDALKITLVLNKDESEFDPLFVSVLGARIAADSAEYITQSNTKKADAFQLYRDAVAEAGRANAYVIGPEGIVANDGQYDFLTARL